MNTRPGPARDLIGEFVAAWLRAIEHAVCEAQSRDEVAPEIDPAQLAFETNAMLVAANLAFPLFGDRKILERARLGMRERLRSAAAMNQDVGSAARGSSLSAVRSAGLDRRTQTSACV